MHLSRPRLSAKRVSLASPGPEFLSAIKAAGYPHVQETRQYADRAFILKVGDGCYVWFFWADASHETIEINAAVPQDLRSRWLTRGIVQDIYTIVRVLGPKRIIANPTTRPALKALLRLGFRQQEGGAFAFEVYSADDSIPVG